MERGEVEREGGDQGRKEEQEDEEKKNRRTKRKMRKGDGRRGCGREQDE
jgi:hypothetical protein